MKNFTVIGIDPGIANTGLCVLTSDRIGSKYQIKATELVKTPSNDDTGERLNAIHEALCRLLDTHAPEAIAIERVFHNKNINSSISTGKVIGLCELTAYNYEIPTMILSPQAIKAASGFGGSANKDEMLKTASRIFSTKIKSHHVVDAAFCGLAGILQIRCPNGKK